MELTEKELAEKMRAKMARDRESQRRWREKQKKSGKRSMTVLISDDVYQILARIKSNTRQSFAEIIEHAIIAINQ